MARLNRADVERGISEMWAAMSNTPSALRDEGYDEAVADCYATEARLRRELDAQDRLDAAAPELLAACKAFVEAWEKSHQLEKTDVALGMARAAIAHAETEV